MPDTILTFDSLRAGDVVGNQFASDGVTIRVLDPSTPPMVFDSANPTGADTDLATDNLGNVLIISEDGDSTDPDDNQTGGTIVFEFSEPSFVASVTVLDIERHGFVRAFDADGAEIARIIVPVGGDGVQAQLQIGLENVSRLDMELRGSGAIDYLAFRTPHEADGIVWGKAGDDVIDVDYTGDPDGDRIDAGDAVLPGEAANDDIVKAGDGNDSVHGRAGNDEIRGGRGKDVLRGGAGNDEIHGWTGDDALFGGGDDDTLFGDDGDDRVDGGAGNDTLIGGAGADEQSGGDGRDVFIIGAAEDGSGDNIDGGAGGDDFDTLDLTGAGPLNITYLSPNRESGYVEFLDASGGIVTGSLTFNEIETVVPCFTPGTSIATPRGEILVEDLQVGDSVITRDNGIQEIRWIGAKSMDGRDLQENPHLQPILLQRGSLGNGLPERDMLVSPNHRMLVGNDRVSLYFDEHEVLVSAKHLLNPKAGVQTINSMGTTYIHFMFEKHEVILANGAWSESFQPGDYTLKGIGNAQRNEIFELFPELREQKGQTAYASARLTLKRHEAKMLLR